MEIIFHAHRAAITPSMQQRAEQSIRKIVLRMGRAVDAVVRFEEDGPTRRVELMLHAPRGRRLVARGEARHFGPALADAIERLDARVAHVKRRSGAAARRASARKPVTPKAAARGKASA
jgi:ribosome-associated translation inhibitor RaiA